MKRFLRPAAQSTNICAPHRAFAARSAVAGAWAARPIAWTVMASAAAFVGCAVADASAPAPAPLKSAYQYVIVGTGIAGYSALETILKDEPDASILVVSADEHPPHYLPALSKELWQANHMPSVSTTLEYKDAEGQATSIFFAEGMELLGLPNVTYLRGTTATGLDAEKKILTLEDGRSVTYGECLLATGASPKSMGGYEQTDGVMTFRSIDDFKKLIELQRKGKDILVVGGGYLGTELVDAMNHRSKEAGVNANPRGGKKQRQVTMVVPEPGVLYRFLPRYLSDFAANKMAQHGIDMRTNTLITDVRKNANDEHLTVELTVRTLGNLRTGPGSNLKGWADIRKYTVKTDVVVMAIGVNPNISLAKTAGLETDAVNGGIAADASLQVHPHLYSAGDAVSYYDPVLGRRRMEHWEHGRISGELAGRNMMRAQNGDKLKKWSKPSSFWCDLNDLGIHCEAVGTINSSLRTIGFLDVSKKFFSPPDDHVPPFETSEYTRGVVYYFDNNKVVGVLLWNLDSASKLEAARRLVQKGTVVDDPLDLRREIVRADGKPFREIHTS